MNDHKSIRQKFVKAWPVIWIVLVTISGLFLAIDELIEVWPPW
jgi:hypothetical protein